MAAHLRRQVLSLPHLLRLSSSEISGSRSLTTDAVVELKPGEIGMVSGIPQEHLRRKVVIYSPARTATQQGSGKVGRWKINFMSTHKWENPLMGWTSTGDPYANVGDAGLSFDSAEAAASFAEKHGWDYVEVEELKKKKMENRNRKTIRKAQVDKKESPSNLVISLSQITVTRPQPNKFLTKKFRLRSVTHHF